MKVLLNVIFIVALFSLCSGCAANRYVLRTNDATEGSLVIENKDEPGQLYIIVKSKHALESTLNRLKCSKRPCMIGRLGEVFIIERPEVEERPEVD